MEEEDFEDEIDPRIKGELDTLNQSTDEINALETELIEHRQKFKSTLENATGKLQKLAKKNGKAIDRARPYYTTKREVAQAELALQRAVHNFQRAIGVHRAAKETIALAEARLSEFDDKKVDMAWQEMLNLQTMRFMEAEKDRNKSEQLHARAAKKFEFFENKMQAQKKKHKKSVSKTRPYFELKELLELDLQKKRQKVEELQRKVEGAKKRYRQSLDNLEKISSEIHEKRRQSAGKFLDDRQTVDSSEETVDGQLPNNPLDLDLVGPSTYDDIEQLEEELDNFNIDDEEEDLFSSGSESDDDSDASTPSIEGKRHQLTRSNTAPARRFEEAGMARRKPTRAAVKRQQPVIQRAVSVNDSSGPFKGKYSYGASNRESDDAVFKESVHDISAIQEDTEDSPPAEEGEEKDEATYRRLHGTNINREKGGKPPLPPKPKKPLAAPDNFDIFDELC